MGRSSTVTMLYGHRQEYLFWFLLSLRWSETAYSLSEIHCIMIFAETIVWQSIGYSLTEQQKVGLQDNKNKWDYVPGHGRTNLAVEGGGEFQACPAPIAVEDLNQPGHMLIKVWPISPTLSSKFCWHATFWLLTFHVASHVNCLFCPICVPSMEIKFLLVSKLIVQYGYWQSNFLSLYSWALEGFPLLDYFWCVPYDFVWTPRYWALLSQAKDLSAETYISSRSRSRFWCRCENRLTWSQLLTYIYQYVPFVSKITDLTISGFRICRWYAKNKGYFWRLLRWSHV